MVLPTASSASVMWRALSGRAGHLGDAAGVVGDRAEGVHRQDVGGGHQHAHRRDGGAEDAGRERGVDARRSRRCEPRTNEATSARPIAIAVAAVVSKPTAVPMMMFVAGPVLRGLGDLLDRPPGAGGVVLGDVDEGDAGRRCRRGRRRRTSTSRRPSITFVVMNRPTTDRIGDDVVAVVQRRHRVLLPSSFAKNGTESRPTIVAMMPNERRTSGKMIHSMSPVTA